MPTTTERIEERLLLCDPVLRAIVEPLIIAVGAACDANLTGTMQVTMQDLIVDHAEQWGIAERDDVDDVAFILDGPLEVSAPAADPYVEPAQEAKSSAPAEPDLF